MEGCASAAELPSDCRQPRSVRCRPAGLSPRARAHRSRHPRRRAGLERQLALCASPGAGRPAWCGDAALVGALRGALDRLWAAVEAHRDQAFSEARWAGAWGWWWRRSAGSTPACTVALPCGGLRGGCGLRRTLRPESAAAAPPLPPPPLPLCPQVWSWAWEPGSGYRVASLAENSATSTEGNAVQARPMWGRAAIAHPGRALRGVAVLAARGAAHSAGPGGCSWSDGPQRWLELPSWQPAERALMAARPFAWPQLWSFGFLAVPDPTGTGTLLES